MEERQQTQRKKTLPKIVYILLALSVSTVWGYGFIMVDNATGAGMGEWTLLCVRFFLAAALIFAVRLAVGKKSELREKFSSCDWVWGVIVGAVNFGGFLLQTMSLSGSGKTDTGRCALFTGSYVVLVSVASCVLHKKFSLRSVLTAVVFFVGLIVLLAPENSGGLKRGDLLAMLCSLFFAAQILLISRAKNVNLLNFNVVQMLTMGVLGGIGAVLFDGGTMVALFKGRALLAVLYLALFASAYAYIVQIVVQKRLSESLSAILLSLESVASVLFSLCFGYTQFSYSLLIGGVIMVGASIVASLADGKEEEKAKGEKEETQCR